MRVLASTACAVALVLPIGPANADGPASGAGVDLGWEIQTNADPDTSAGVGLGDLVLDELQPSGVGSGSGCRSGTRTVTTRILYRDAAGLPAFSLESAVTFSWNCRVVTRISQVPKPETYQPHYRFTGYVHRNVSPTGQKSGKASVQGRFGICQTIVGETCVMERVPLIATTVYANGRATQKTTP